MVDVGWLHSRLIALGALFLLAACSATAEVEPTGQLAAASAAPAPTTPQVTDPSATAQQSAPDDEGIVPITRAVLPPTFVAEVRTDPSPPLTADQLELPTADAQALLALPVTAAPLELIVDIDERRLQFMAVEGRQSTTLVERSFGAWTGITSTSAWFESEPLLVHRWRFGLGELSTFQIPSGDRIDGVLELDDGAFAIASLRINDVEYYMSVFEASGELRCTFTARSIRFGDHGAFQVESNGQTSFASAQLLDTDTCAVAAEARPNSLYGEGHEGAMFSAKRVGDSDGREEYQIERHELEDGVPVLRGESETLFISRVLSFGHGSVWASGRDGKVYRIAADTLEVERVWSFVSEFDIPRFHLTHDAVWVTGFAGSSINAVVRIDLASNELERYQLPFDGSPFSRLTPYGLLLGRPGTGYFFNFDGRRFERLPDWLIADTIGARYWQPVPGPGDAG